VGGARSRAISEVAEVVGEDVALKAHSVSGEEAAGQPRPFDRALALLDPLLRHAALVVEACSSIGADRAPHHQRQNGADNVAVGQLLGKFLQWLARMMRRPNRLSLPSFRATASAKAR